MATSHNWRQDGKSGLQGRHRLSVHPLRRQLGHSEAAGVRNGLHLPAAGLAEAMPLMQACDARTDAAVDRLLLHVKLAAGRRAAEFIVEASMAAMDTRDALQSEQLDGARCPADHDDRTRMPGGVLTHMAGVMVKKHRGPCWAASRKPSGLCGVASMHAPSAGWRANSNSRGASPPSDG